MTKRKITPETEAIEEYNPPSVEVKAFVSSDGMPEGTKAVQTTPVVALLDQMVTARLALYAAAKADESVPVPEVLARALEGTDDVLLTVWRAWDIYATHTDDGWMIRADQVR